MATPENSTRNALESKMIIYSCSEAIFVPECPVGCLKYFGAGPIFGGWGFGAAKHPFPVDSHQAVSIWFSTFTVIFSFLLFASYFDLL